MNHPCFLGCFGGPSGRSLPRCVAILFTLTLLGCGQPPAPETPPAPAAAEPAADEPQSVSPTAPPTDSPAAVPAAEERGNGEPPGQLELPTDFNPQTQSSAPAAPPADAAGSGNGFQMPASPTAAPNEAPAASASPAADSPPAAGDSPAAAEQASSTAESAAGESAATESAAGDAAAVTLQAASWETMAPKITATRRVTVVDVWSLACEPCLKEFPHLVAMHRDLGDRVACISVNSDYDGRRTRPAESYRARVEDFLKSVDAGPLTNYLSETASDDLFAALKIQSIPAVLIYDAEGKLVRTFSDVGADAGFTYTENVLPFVQELLQNR